MFGWIIALFCLSILLAVLSIHLPKGNTHLGEILDRTVQYAGILAIPAILGWFQWKSYTEQKQRQKSTDDQAREQQQKHEQQRQDKINKNFERYKKAIILGLESLAEWCSQSYSNTTIEQYAPKYFTEGLVDGEINTMDETHNVFGLLARLNLVVFGFNNVPEFKFLKDISNYSEATNQIIQKFKNGDYDFEIIKFLEERT
ncbi:MAG: DNA-binding domain-containing protein [Brevinema sp.]